MDKDELIDALYGARKHSPPRPVIHITMTDGRVTALRDIGIVLPEGDEGVVALLMTPNGVVYNTPDGLPAIVEVPVFELRVQADPNKLLSWKQVARRAGVSLATAKRFVDDGTIPKPTKIGKRKIGFRQGDVDQALAKLRSGKKLPITFGYPDTELCLPAGSPTPDPEAETK